MVDSNLGIYNTEGGTEAFAGQTGVQKQGRASIVTRLHI